MLLHLPTAILATLSLIAVSGTVPKFDIANECGVESKSSKAFERCSHDEAEALQKLRAEWPQFAGADRSVCLVEGTVAGFASYVELLICLEMARDVRNERANPRGPVAKTGAQPTPPAQPEMTVVDKIRLIGLRNDFPWEVPSHGYHDYGTQQRDKLN